MYKQCQTARSEERQREIARTLMEMLQSKSLSSITVTELCQRAAIPRKAFYRYFDSTEDIIQYVVDQLLQRHLETAFTKDRMLSGTEYCIEIFRFWHSHPDLLRVLTNRECLGLFATAATLGILENEIGFSHITCESHQRRLTALFTTAGFINLLVYWTHNDFQESPEEMGMLMQKLISRPLYQ